MVMFNSMEDIFQELRNLNEYSRALVTFTTTIGALVILLYFVKFMYSVYQGFRIYILSQFCCKTDLKKYGEWAVISGATDGIGLSIAKELARRGHSLIVIGRNEEKLANTKRLLEEETEAGKILTVKIDLSDSSPQNYDRIRSQIDPDNRDIGILFNNAGVFPSKFMRFNRYDIDELVSGVNVNVLATVHLTRMIMPGMLERQRGLVVNISSMYGDITGPWTGVYCPCKAFINRFTRTLQSEYSDHPIDIINIEPGAVHTKLFINTGAIANPSPFNPMPDDYAKSAINALSTRYPSMSGFWAHGLVRIPTQTNESLGLTPSLLKYSQKAMSASDLSPVMKRKKSPATPASGDAIET